MQILISYSKQETFLADAIAKAIKRLIPNAIRIEPTEAKEKEHIILRTKDKAGHSKRGRG